MAEGAMEEGDFSSPLPPLARVVPLNVRTMNEIHTKETASYAGRRDRLFSFFYGYLPTSVHSSCRDSSNRHLLLPRFQQQANKFQG